MRASKPTPMAILEKVVKQKHGDSITLGEIVAAMHERGFGLLLMLSALPVSMPIPVPPGYPTIFAVPIFFFAVQMMMGREHAWLPRFLKCIKIRRRQLGGMMTKAGPRLRWIERLLRPRLTFAATPLGKRMVGGMAFLFAIPIALPLPLSNFLPGFGILLMALGLLAKDGLTVLAGMVAGWLGIGLTFLVVLAGEKALADLLDVVRGWIGF